MPSLGQVVGGLGIAAVIILSSIPFVKYDIQGSSVDPTVCTSQHKGDREGCLADRENDCVWCVPKAVPSACYNSEVAADLPGSVFKCESPPSQDILVPDVELE